MRVERTTLLLLTLLASLANVGPSEARAGPLPKTPSSSWREDGFLDFKFGMGPADVYARLRDPASRMRARTEWFSAGAEPGFSHKFIVTETTYVFAGESVTAEFQFAEGRLVEIGMMQDIERQRSLPADQWLANGRAYADRVANMLQEEYGEAPVPSPDEGDSEARVWTRDRIFVRLSSLGAISFRYRDEYDAARRRGEARVQAANQDVEAGRLSKTAPSTWLGNAWMSLRWGMGPGDVAQRIAPSRLRAPKNNYSLLAGRTLESDLESTLFGRYLKGDFRFAKGRLVAVSLSASEPEQATDEAMREWHARILEGLRKKYGRPTCDSLGCHWTRSGTRIELFGHKMERFTVLLSYTQERPTGGSEEQGERSKL